MTNTLNQTDPSQFQIPGMNSEYPTTPATLTPDLLQTPPDTRTTEFEQSRYVAALTEVETAPIGEAETARIEAHRILDQAPQAEPTVVAAQAEVAERRPTTEVDPVASATYARTISQALGQYRTIVAERENRADYALAA